MKLLTNLKKFR